MQREGSAVVRGERTATFADVSIEEVRAYWDRRPCNIRHSPKPVGTREYFDEVEARKYFVEPHIPLFAQFERWRDARVLEVGCGIGTDTINFARAGAGVTAVDLSPLSLQIARRRAEAYGLADRIRLFAANAEELSQVVPPEPYDLIYAFGMLHHTPRPHRVLAEFRRYSRPGTVLKLMVYHRFSWKVLEIVLGYGRGQVWKMHDLVARYSEAQEGSPVTLTYSRREIRDLVARYGFRVRELFVEHIFPYRIPEYVRYEYKRAWYFQAMPRPLFRWLETHLGWHLCVTAEAEAGHGSAAAR